MAKATSRLHELTARGQSVWFDTLSRDLIHSGELRRMMDEDAVTGVTSNPTIFQKALSEGDAYDEDLFIVRSVEDGDLALARSALVNAPQEVVSSFFGGRYLERCDVAALWIESRHDAPDRAVLARRIHAL